MVEDYGSAYENDDLIGLEKKVFISGEQQENGMSQMADFMMKISFFELH